MGSIDTSKPRVAFIGLGAMGSAMSTHLVRVLFPVTGYDVFAPTLDRWSAACADIPNSTYSTGSSLVETIQDADIVLLMVANHYHVHSALFEPDAKGQVVAKLLPKGITVLCMATIPPTQPGEIRKRLTEEFGRGDVKLIDAPVSGGTARSKNGTLTIMASSDDPKNLKDEKAQTVLRNLANEGKTLYPIPGGLGSGESAKALNQVMCGIHIAAGSEIMGLAAVLGLDTKAFFDSITSADSSTDSKKILGWTWMLENRGPRMLTSEPEMSSATLIIDKDVGIIRDEEVRLGIELGLLNKASDVIKEVMVDYSKADDSVIVQHYLGINSDKKSLVVERNGKSSLFEGSDEKELQKAIAKCHAIISLVAAMETVKFGVSLGLDGPEQKKMWFSIISGAAGGSTTFSKAVPMAFNTAPDNTDVGFRKYLEEDIGFDGLKAASDIVKKAKGLGYEPRLLELAVTSCEKLVQ